jgi:hypothetical protein
VQVVGLIPIAVVLFGWFLSVRGYQSVMTSRLILYSAAALVMLSSVVFASSFPKMWRTICRVLFPVIVLVGAIAIDKIAVPPRTSTTTVDTRSEPQARPEQTQPAGKLIEQTKSAPPSSIPTKKTEVSAQVRITGQVSQTNSGPCAINNIGGTVSGNTCVSGPPPLPTPNVKVCVLLPEPTKDGYSTKITLTTDGQIKRPFFVFLFDGPVEASTATDYEVDHHAFGVEFGRADKLPNPEGSSFFRLTSIDFGTNIRFPSDGPIKVNIQSKDLVKLINIMSGGGESNDRALIINITYHCN